MTYFYNKEYIKLLSDFCSSIIPAKEFDNKYSKQWETDRDKKYEKKKRWLRPYDVELINNFKQGKINENEFHKSWNKLFGYTEESSLIQNILDRIYTTCNCYWPDISAEEVDPPLVLDDKLFLQEVQELFQELKILLKRLG